VDDLIEEEKVDKEEDDLNTAAILIDVENVTELKEEVENKTE
jgi:hypothetical protein